jgi:hypothetical protein
MIYRGVLLLALFMGCSASQTCSSLNTGGTSKGFDILEQLERAEAAKRAPRYLQLGREVCYVMK